MRISLFSLSSDFSSKLHISGHDSNSFGMDGTEIGIFEKLNEISFRSFLKCMEGGALESKFLVKGMGDFSYKSLERKLS